MMSVQQHISIDSVRDYINQLFGYWKYEALEYHIKATEQGIFYGTRKANEYARVVKKTWEELEKLDKPTIERIIMELEGMILRETDKQRKTDLKAVRTITEDFLNLDSWGNSQ